MSAATDRSLLASVRKMAVLLDCMPLDPKYETPETVAQTLEVLVARLDERFKAIQSVLRPVRESVGTTLRRKFDAADEVLIEMLVRDLLRCRQERDALRLLPGVV